MTRHRGDGNRLIDALAYEQRRHEVIDGQRRLGHEATEGRGASEAAKSALGEPGGARSDHQRFGGRRSGFTGPNISGRCLGISTDGMLARL